MEEELKQFDILPLMRIYHPYKTDKELIEMARSIIINEIDKNRKMRIIRELLEIERSDDLLNTTVFTELYSDFEPEFVEFENPFQIDRGK